MCNTVVQDADSEGSFVCEGGWGYQAHFALSVQFCCEPKTALERKVY